jgi:RNA polymerase sigma-70 factor (ECF subfamily)
MIVEHTSVSLLERLRSRPDDDASWRQMVELYQPLLHGWLRRQRVSAEDADDLVQDVLAAVVRELPQFRYDRERGSFRGWLRTILLNRMRGFWRKRKSRPVATGDTDFGAVLDQLQDPHSEMTSRWNEEHDRFVAGRLLERIEAEFEPATWQAFRRVAIEGAAPRDVAAELGISVNAIFIAKSRILRRLREEMRGLTD